LGENLKLGTGEILGDFVRTGGDKKNGEVWGFWGPQGEGKQRKLGGEIF